MNDLDKVSKGIKMGVDLLPLLILLVELIKEIRDIYRESPEAFTPEMMARLRGLIDLEQKVFD